MKLNRIIKNNLYLIPIFMVGISLVSCFVELGAFWGNLMGYSLLVDVFFYYYFIVRGCFCEFTKACVYGLFALNLVCILGEFINYNAYSFYYDITICSITLFLGLLFTLRK